MNDAARVAALTLDGVERRYGRGETTVEVLSRREPRARARPIGRARRALRRRQVDASASGGPVGAAQRRGGDDRRRRDLDDERRQADGAEAHRDRLRLPVPSPAAGVLGAGKPCPAADDRRPFARPGRDPRARAARLSGSRPARDPSPGGIIRRRTAARRHRARGRQWPAGCCWPTSRPAISIRRPPTTCSRRSRQLVKASGLAALVATHNMDLAARMDRRVTIREGRVEEME